MAENAHQETDHPSRLANLDGLAKPAQRALEGAGIVRLEQLTGYRAAEILKLHGMGPKALATLRAALAARGMSFAGEEK